MAEKECFNQLLGAHRTRKLVEIHNIPKKIAQNTLLILGIPPLLPPSFEAHEYYLFFMVHTDYEIYLKRRRKKLKPL